ncbi:MAG: hypothetical protein LBE08_01475 [Bifidobacteriaceae bacterium]|nr:hypothetical protein [Bifidobacteriaceae bacterium]
MALGGLETIAAWYAGIGLPDQPALSEQIPGWYPDTVTTAHHRLHALRARDLVAVGTRLPALVHGIDLAITRRADARVLTILRRRVFATEPDSLESLGQTYGITRERVRQLEERALRRLVEDLDALSIVTAVREALAQPGPRVRRLSDVLDSIPALGAVLPSLGQPVWRVFERLDRNFEVSDGWWVRPTMQEAIKATRASLASVANPHGVVPLDAVNGISAANPEALREFREQWLIQCGITVFGEFALLRTISVADYAAGLLSAVGEPLSSHQLIESLGPPHSIQSLRNRLSKNERFTRTDRDRWALREWGLREYSGIRREIGKRLELAGGTMPLEELIDELTHTFSISPASVVAYAAAPPYHSRDGIVSLAPPGAETSKPPKRTARLFRVPGGWAYRTRVRSSHLRGCGSPAPVAITAILNLQFGQSRELTSSLGPQFMYWNGLHPTFGTIRRFLVGQGIPVGADVFLVIRDDGSFSVDPVRPPTGEPLADALSLIDAPATDNRDEAGQALARAIGLPDSTTGTALIKGYKQRGDTNIARLLERVYLVRLFESD